MGVDARQREEPPCRVQQGPAVMKASRAAVNLPLVGHSHADNLAPSHLGGQVTLFSDCDLVNRKVGCLLPCFSTFILEGPMFLTAGG